MKGKIQVIKGNGVHTIEKGNLAFSGSMTAFLDDLFVDYEDLSIVVESFDFPLEPPITYSKS
jgi:hypothetical protein